MMKRRMTGLMTLALSMAVSATVWAGGFEQFTDFQNADGTYSYYFDEGVLVTMDEDWYQKTIVIPGDRGATFYQKASYDAYANEGVEGGRLFSIGASVNTSFQELPSFEYIGFDDETVMNYYAELPTDYQAYMGDEAIRAEYDELWAGVKDVIAGIQIGVRGQDSNGQETGGQTAADPETGTQVQVSEGPSAGTGESTSEINPYETEPQILMYGDYNYWVNADRETVTIAEYTGDENIAVEIPSEIGGYQVSAIGPDAFEYKAMKSLTIPDSVSNIRIEAFEYCVITDTLKLPENVLIGDNAFAYTNLPKAVAIPAGALVGDCAFSECRGLETVFLGPGAEVKGRAFGYCDDLQKVVCGNACNLESRAFEYCEKLGTIIFCGSVETVEDSFSYCGKIYMNEASEDEFEALAVQNGLNYGTGQTGTANAGGNDQGQDTSDTQPDIGAFLTGGTNS